MGAVAQLWLLLWKCWKTTIRSLGWSIVQCLFTLVLWAILIYIATSDVGTFLKYGLPNSPNQDSPRNEIPREYDTSIEIEYKCEGLCNETQPDIRDAANSVCADSNICTMTENPAEWHNTWLKLYKLNDDPPKLDVDYELPEGYTTCVRFSRSSEQFDHGWFERCKATPVFQPLIAWIGHTDQFKVEWIRKTTDDLYSEITEARMGFWLVFYCIPLVLFCAQSTREVSEEASSNMKDYLLSMGMSRSMYYLHHFIYTYLKAWISIIGCSVIFGYIFEYKIGLLLFSIFSLSLLSWVGMSLMIGALIKKPGTSTFVFLIVSLALTFASTVNGVKRTNILLTLFLSLFPQFAVQMAMDSFREQDFRGVSIAFGDVGQAVQYGYILIIMSLSAGLNLSRDSQ